MEIQGTVVQVLPLQEGVGKASQKPWKKQDYILEIQSGQFPKKVCFNLWGDNIDRFAIKEGEFLTVQIDIESREFNGRWYTDVRAWQVDRGMGGVMPQPAQPSSWQTAPAAPSNNSWTTAPSSLDGMPQGGDPSDLPF